MPFKVAFEKKSSRYIAVMFRDVTCEIEFAESFRFAAEHQAKKIFVMLHLAIILKIFSPKVHLLPTLFLSGLNNSYPI